MSYILDALKRADAERGRGQVPGLNAIPLGSAPPVPTRASAQLGWWVAGALLLVLAAGAAWWALRPAAPAPVLKLVLVDFDVERHDPHLQAFRHLRHRLVEDHRAQLPQKKAGQGARGDVAVLPVARLAEPAFDRCHGVGTGLMAAFDGHDPLHLRR